MRDDNLASVDLLDAIRNFEIIEEYPNAEPFRDVYCYVGSKERILCM